MVLVVVLGACNAGGSAQPRAAKPTPRAAGSTTAAPTTTVVADTPRGDRYDIGTPALTDIWVDPERGDDDNDGSTRDQALATITAAWQRIPTGAQTTGVRIALAAGEYAANDMPNYWDERTASREAPIVIESVDGPGKAETANINAFGLTYFYVIGVALRSEFDVFHCEQCDHLLLRNVILEGTDGAPQETLKVNQSTNVFVEDSDIGGATDNALDFVAVQYGHIVGNRIHDADDWCAYTKGGSAQIRVTGNEFYDCGTGGFTAGQGTGFQFMTPPFFTYEATDITFADNVIHDTEGAAFGAGGASNAVFERNVAYDVGRRSHVIEVVLGRRGCDGAPDDRDAVAKCRQYLSQGGWGTTGEELEMIPARNVIIRDNVIVNDTVASSSSHFMIHQCQTVDTAATNVASPSCVTEGLVIAGNVIWNGNEDLATGAEGDLDASIRSQNEINERRPEITKR